MVVRRCGVLVLDKVRSAYVYTSSDEPAFVQSHQLGVACLLISQINSLTSLFSNAYELEDTNVRPPGLNWPLCSLGNAQSSDTSSWAYGGTAQMWLWIQQMQRPPVGQIGGHGQALEKLSQNRKKKRTTTRNLVAHLLLLLLLTTKLRQSHDNDDEGKKSRTQPPIVLTGQPKVDKNDECFRKCKEQLLGLVSLERFLDQKFALPVPQPNN